LSPTRQPLERIVGERRLTLGDAKTRALEVEGDGPPILFLHGYADSADCWRPLLERMAEVERAAMAIDLTGFGTASELDPKGLLLPQWDRVVAAAVAELAGDGDVILVGNSLGGCLSMRAAQDPDLPVAGVVPIAPAGLEMARWFPIIESERMIRLLRLSPLPVPEVVVREIVGRVYRTLAFHDPKIVDPAQIASFAKHFGSLDRSMGILDVGRRLLPELESPFDLKAIDCPLLLVWGERDRMVYTGGAERVLRTVDYSDIEILPDIGHCPQVEAPDRMAELILSFPQSLEFAD